MRQGCERHERFKGNPKEICYPVKIVYLLKRCFWFDTNITGIAYGQPASCTSIEESV